MIRTFIIFLLSFIIFLPFVANAHYVGFTHHELTLEYNENSLIVRYNINLTYADFSSIYNIIDPDKNDIIEELDATKWLNSWNDKVSIQIGEKAFNPIKLYDFSNLNLIKSSLYPSFRFRIDFGKFDNQSGWEKFKLNHDYRVGQDQREYFSFMADKKNLVFEPTTYPQETSIEGVLKETKSTNPTSRQEQISTNFPSFLQTDLYKYLYNFFDNVQNNPFSLLVIIGLGFIIGVLHSLSPGHGKTIMGSYITMTESNLKNIILLATSITISHIFIVLVLVFLFIWLRNGLFFQFFDLSFNLGFDLKFIMPYLTSISGIIVISIGLYLIFDRLKTRYIPRELKKTSQKNFFSLYTNYVILNDGNHIHKIPRYQMNTKQSIVLGISSGLVPCVEIVSLLIIAINIDKIWSGLAVLIAFSLGMSFTLITIGWVMKKGLDRSQNIKFMEKFYKNIPLISAVLITISGVFTLIWGLSI